MRVVLISLFIVLGATVASMSMAQNTITVQGSAQIGIEPDRVAIRLNLGAQDPSASVALTQARAHLAMLGDRLAAAGFAALSLRTEQISVLPFYRSYEKPVFDYMQANLNVTLAGADQTDLGPVLDAIVQGDGIQINSVDFYASDTHAFEQMARLGAMENARDAAQTYAQAGGMELGAIVQISETIQGAGPMVMATREFTPATQQISASVTVVYELTH